MFARDVYGHAWQTLNKTDILFIVYCFYLVYGYFVSKSGLATSLCLCVYMEETGNCLYMLYLLLSAFVTLAAFISYGMFN